MLTLSLDTATGPCSVAVLRRGDVLSLVQEQGARMQAKRLLPMVEEALREAGAEYSQISDIVSTVGPGSFSGLRVGLTTARMLGFALGVPVKGITTLAAVAATAWQEGRLPCTVSLNAGKGEVYAQDFALADGVPIPASEPAITAPRVDMFSVIPNAAHAGLLAAHTPALLCAPTPFYIRPPDALPQKGGLSLQGACG